MKNVTIDVNEHIRLTQASEEVVDTEESMSSSTDTNVNEQMVNQDAVRSTQRRLMGAFVVYLGRICGIHPIKAPYFCSTTECKKLRFRDRLNRIDIAICLFNIFVSLNHIYIRFFSKGAYTVWMSADKAKWMQTLTSSFSPLLVIVATASNSPGTDRLLYLMSSKKKDIVDSNNHQRIRKWTSIMFILNLCFGLVMILHFVQILLLDIVHYNFYRKDALDNDFMFLLDEVRDVITTVLTELDRRYYNVMSFIVIKVPQVMIMMIAIENALMFSECNRIVERKKLYRERLQRFFDEFHRIETIQAQLERTFNKTIFIILVAKMTDITLRLYILARYMVNMSSKTQSDVALKIVIGETKTARWGDEFWAQLEFALLLSGWTLRFFWTIAFVLSLIYCNEKKDQLIQKYSDQNWGITMWKFIHMDRSALLTMISIVFTIVAVWLQIHHKTS